MLSEVSVKFSSEHQFRIGTEGFGHMTDQEARAWLDQEYEDFGCEPLNPVGKVLNADKAICVARAAGHKMFAENPEWARAFAQAVLLTLHRPVVCIDVEGMSIGY
jgi:hypothetical protein